MSRLDKIKEKVSAVVEEKKIEIIPEEKKEEETTESKIEEKKEIKPKSPSEQLISMIVDKMQFATDEQKHKSSQTILHLMAKVSANPQVFGMFVDRANVAQTARLVTQIVSLDLPFASQDMYYIIPYKNTLSLQLSYYGLLEIAYRAGVYNVQTNVVYEGDDFDYYFSDNNHFVHKPKHTSETPKFYYASCKVAARNGEKSSELLLTVFTEKQMQEFKKKYAKYNPLWNSDYLNMAKKTMIKQLLKLCPKRALDVELLSEGESDE